MWSARVHKTGSQIQLLKDGSVTKIIRSASDTFMPVEAKDFASNLVNNLNEKVAKQMINPNAQPTVATESDQHQKSLKAVNSDAKGISPKDMSKISAVLDENTNLKKKIAKLEKEASVERKARRGLAIVKALVDQKKIANDQNIIKSEVMKIVAMSNDEISLLERKVAGLPLYESVESAEMASRRYARHARLHRQAAEDAQMAGNDTLADEEDVRAANYENLSKQAADSYKQFDAKPEGIKSDDIASQVVTPAKGVDVQGKKASTDEDIDLDDEKVASDDVEEEIEEDDIEDEDDFEDDDSADDELIDTEEEIDVEAAASIYRKIAANHTKKAEELKAVGKEKEADTEMEIAGEAEQLASAVESSSTKEASTDTFKKDAADIYRKIAVEHRKKADDLETAGKTEEADVEDEIADEAEQLAACVETKTDTEVKTDEVEDKAKVSETEVQTEKAGEQPKVEEATVKEAITETKTEDTEENDPLAELIEEDKEASVTDAAKEETSADMPTDEEIMAAVSSPEDEEEVAVEDTTEKVGETTDSIDDLADDDVTEVADSGEEKEADDKGTKKTANVGYQASEFDKVEQNSMTNDPMVRELEGIWRKDNQ